MEGKNFLIFWKNIWITYENLTKNKNWITSLNKEYNTPIILASNLGCNIALKLMPEFFLIDFLKKSSEFSSVLLQTCINENINIVRFLIEYGHYF